MPGIVESEFEPRHRRYRFAVWHPLEICKTRLGILARVERRDESGATVALPAIFPLGILFVQVARIGQHDLAQCSGCLLDIDGAGEALFEQYRHPPGMIDVRMTEDDSIDVVDRDRQSLTIPALILSIALYQAALEQHGVRTCPQYIKRSRDFASGTETLDLESHVGAVTNLNET